MRAAPPILLVLALLAAGCLGTPSEAPGAASPSNATAKTNATVAVDDGTMPTMGTAGAMPHMHDYWKGKERVTLFEGDLEPDAANTTFATIFQAFTEKGAYVGGMLWNLPDGQTVYEGTGKMEITASWTDPRVTSMGFIYRSADSPDYKKGAALPNGKAFDLAITPKMTDMPHAKTSRWQFGFGPDSSPGSVAGPFHLKLDIVRLGDINLFPGHPDFWQGKHEIVRLDADHHGQAVSYPKRITQPATQGNFTEDEVQLAKPVPMEATAVRFDVTVSSASSTPGKVVQLGFFYHGADSTQMLRCAEKPLNASLPATLTWTVAAGMQASDSPYETGSMWRFLVEPQTTMTGADPVSGGTTDTDIVYHVVATAIDSEVKDLTRCSLDRRG